MCRGRADRAHFEEFDGDAAAGRLVIIAVIIALAALIASEWFARRAGMRFQGE